MLGDAGREVECDGALAQTRITLEDDELPARDPVPPDPLHPLPLHGVQSRPALAKIRAGRRGIGAARRGLLPVRLVERPQGVPVVASAAVVMTARRDGA